MAAMTRVFGASPQLGFRLLHGHRSPLPGTPSFIHVSETVCTPDHAMAPHAHDVFEFCYVISGKGERMLGATRIEVEAGDLLILQPGQVHSSRADRQDPYHFFAIAFDPERLGLGSTQPMALSAACTAVLSERLVHGVAGAEHIIRGIILALDRVDADARMRELTELQVQLLMLQLLVLGSRCTMASQQAPGSASSIRTPRRKDFVELLAWIASRLSYPPSVPVMAARVGLTPAHFSMAFRREVGSSPVAYLLSLRCEEAARRLLADNSTSITTIAHDLGFPSSQYFSQVFRRNIGMTPSQWRRSRQHSPR